MTLSHRAMRYAVITTLAWMGCAEVHTLPDATVDAGIDAGGRDSGPPDAFTCGDRDGDGALDARCGGDDCDDEDAEISPDRGPCADPTHAVRCVDGARATVACPAELPECDARVGECVAAGGACGDGALHASEECDDANEELIDGCDLGCRFGICPYDTVCRVPGAPWCIRLDETFEPRCSPGHPGAAPLGERCEADAECESGWCSPVDRRCTFFCYHSAHCVERGGWCGREGTNGIGYGGLPIELSYACVWPCDGPADCEADEACTLALAAVHYPDAPADWDGVTYCAPIAGPLPIGAACVAGEECSTNVCRDRVCTRVCATDADCADLPGSVCAPVEALARRSPPFSTPYVSVCERSSK